VLDRPGSCGGQQASVPVTRMLLRDTLKTLAAQLQGSRRQPTADARAISPKCQPAPVAFGTSKSASTPHELRTQAQVQMLLMSLGAPRAAALSGRQLASFVVTACVGPGRLL